MTRKLSLFCLVCLLWPLPWLSGAQANPRYDLAFKHWGEFYLPWQDWRWWKAQGIAESGLNQAALGSEGEIGVMQLLPRTAELLRVDPFDAESNIQGGIKYDRQLWDRWAGATDHRELMFASYNAGPANVQRASKIEGSTVWWIVARGLTVVTGAHVEDTIAYVDGINQNYSELR